jgi:hypothetical protein
MTKKEKIKIKDLVWKNMDEIEDEINTHLRKLIDNALGYEVGTKKWEQALEYARKILFQQEI